MSLFFQKKRIAIYLFIFIVFLSFSFLYFWRHFTFNADDRVYLGSDFLAYFYPSYLTAIERIQLGDFLPLWDSTQYMGMPFIARIGVAFFYPFNLLLFFVSVFFNLSWPQISFLSFVIVIIHLALAGCFTYFFSRKVLRLNSFESVVAGLVYSFSGIMIASVNTVGVLESLVWLPLLLLLLENLLNRCLLISVLPLSLVFTVSILAGYPYAIVYNSLFLLGYFLYRVLFPSTTQLLKKKALLLLLSMFLGVGLASIQLIPFLELAHYSYRQRLEFSGSAFSLPIHPSCFIDYVFPFYFSRLGEYYEVGCKGFANYVGAAPLILSLFSVLSFKNRKKILFFVFSLIVSLFISLGGFSFLHSIFYIFVPFYSKLRTISIASYLSSFSLSILTAYGINFLLKESKVGWARKQSFLKLLALFLIALISLSLAKHLDIYKFKEDAVGLKVLIKEMEMFNTFILYIGLSVLFIFLCINKIHKNVFKIAIFFLILIDLFSIGRFFRANNSKVPPYSFFNRENEVIEFLTFHQEKDTPFRVDLGGLSFHYNSAPFNLDQVGGYQSLAPRKTASVFIPFIEKLAKGSNLYRISNVRYFVSTSSLDKESKMVSLTKTIKLNNRSRRNDWIRKNNYWENPSSGSKIFIYEADTLPRFFLSNSIVTKDEEYIFPILAETDDLRTVVVQNGLLEYDVVNRLNASGKLDKSDFVKVVKYSHGTAELDAQTGSERILVFSDTYFPGWKAFVDGIESEIIPVNYFMKGVLLSPGSHRVVFSYKPSSFYTGLLISSLSALVAVCLVFLGRKSYGY